ncbi:MAG: hypothetical protein E7080_10755 [Bacteroidales bacterium]|nr:hypothetical protein [Bacteroidales bacterium]
MKYIIVVIFLMSVFYISAEDAKMSSTEVVKNDYLPKLINAEIILDKEVLIPLSIERPLRGADYDVFVKKYGEPQYSLLMGGPHFRNFNWKFKEFKRLVHNVCNINNCLDFYIVESLWNLSEEERGRDRLIVHFIAIDNELIAFYGYYYHDVGGL